ncbi:MAG: ClbS/DfsB family four-helix bundle protein [Chloroflexi bacterium]|nr:ClbS/DfsB family four-helix bundle protein [Chloroflexota bacterium]
MNKEELLGRLEEGRESFLEAIEGLGEEVMLEVGAMGAWTLKDMLSHLTRWEAELVRMLWQAKQGERPTTLLNGPADYDEINARWQTEDRERDLEQILQDFHGVRAQTMRRVEELSESDLGDAGRFPWMKGHALWEEVAEICLDHEREHEAQARAWRAERRG